MSELGKVCEHGSLKRQCYTCELIEDRDRWKKMAERLKNIIEVMGVEFDSIIARLEAAEKVLEPHEDGCGVQTNLDCTCDMEARWEAWRRAKGENESKAAGKDKAGGFIPDQIGEQPSKRTNYE